MDLVKYVKTCLKRNSRRNYCRRLYNSRIGMIIGRNYHVKIYKKGLTSDRTVTIIKLPIGHFAYKRYYQ